MADEDRGPEATTSRAGKEQAAALDRVTDMAEEKQMKAADTTRIQAKMVAFATKQRAAQEAKRQQDKELAAVKIESSDIDVIVREFELDKKQAERELRLAGGDLKLALQSLLKV